MPDQETSDSKVPSGLAKYVPILQWLPNYKWSWLKPDLIAGLSVWALMVPTSLGYATISGVPVQYGLYAAAFGLIAFALFTTSRQVKQGPSSSTAAVLGAAVLSFASAGSDDAISMAAAIVFVAGLLFIACERASLSTLGTSRFAAARSTPPSWAGDDEKRHEHDPEGDALTATATMTSIAVGTSGVSQPARWAVCTCRSQSHRLGRVRRSHRTTRTSLVMFFEISWSASRSEVRT